MSTEHDTIAKVARLEERSAHHQATHERTISRLAALETRMDQRFDMTEARLVTKEHALTDHGYQINEMRRSIDWLVSRVAVPSPSPSATEPASHIDTIVTTVKVIAGILLMAAALSGQLGPDGARAGRALLGM